MTQLRCYCTQCVDLVGKRLREHPLPANHALSWGDAVPQPPNGIDGLVAVPPIMANPWHVGQYICYLREHGEETLADALLSVYVQSVQRCGELQLTYAGGTFSYVTDVNVSPPWYIRSLQQPTAGTGGNTHGNEAGSAVSEGHGSERSDDPHPRPTRPD